MNLDERGHRAASELRSRVGDSDLELGLAAVRAGTQRRRRHRRFGTVAAVTMTVAVAVVGGAVLLRSNDDPGRIVQAGSPTCEVASDPVLVRLPSTEGSFSVRRAGPSNLELALDGNVLSRVDLADFPTFRYRVVVPESGRSVVWAVVDGDPHETATVSTTQGDVVELSVASLAGGQGTLIVGLVPGVPALDSIAMAGERSPTSCG